MQLTSFHDDAYAIRIVNVIEIDMQCVLRGAARHITKYKKCSAGTCVEACSINISLITITSLNSDSHEQQQTPIGRLIIALFSDSQCNYQRLPRVSKLLLRLYLEDICCKLKPQ